MYQPYQAAQEGPSSKLTVARHDPRTMMSQPMNTVIKKELDKQVHIEAVIHILATLQMRSTAEM
jgi:hypothetical protein